VNHSANSAERLFVDNFGSRLAFDYLTYEKGRQMMNEDRTKETNDSRSFQDRVFARFDTIDDRFERVEMRIGKLEDRQYDTKPIWERALAAIAETNKVMLAGFSDFRGQLELINARLDAMDGRLDAMDGRLDSIDDRLNSMDTRFDSMDARFDSMDARFDAMDARFDSMDAKFGVLSHKVEVGSTALQTEVENGLRGVERKIDVLNKNILDLQADQRYVDSRLEKIESQAKPS
jgi:chromosome segregation ATPase